MREDARPKQTPVGEPGSIISIALSAGDEALSRCPPPAITSIAHQFHLYTVTYEYWSRRNGPGNSRVVSCSYAFQPVYRGVSEPSAPMPLSNRLFGAAFR